VKQFSKIILLCIFLISCGGRAKESKQERRTGINGDAIYVFKPDGSLSLMFKEKYSILSFTVFLRNDTLKLGEDFESSITVANPNHTIEITSPDSAKITGHPNSAFETYTFRPEKTGTYDYRGVIEYDSTVANFEYKFIVVE